MPFLTAALNPLARPLARLQAALSLTAAALVVGTAALLAGSAQAADILFIGNSFTYGAGSAARTWRADTVTDLNHQGIGGMPALFKAFTQQAGLRHEVYLETQGGSGLDWHLDNKLGVLGQRPWDVVVMHGFSTLDAKQPGNPATLIATARQMADFLRSRNANVDVRLLATWPRADQVYPATGAWAGKTVEAMGTDLRAGYAQAAAGSPSIKGVLPVGDAWLRAMATGVADSNPYDGIAPGQINLWTTDHYHASAYGYYLEALVVFGGLTGRDPRSLGDTECAAFELGFSVPQVAALQQVAFDQLVASGLAVTANPLKPAKPGAAMACPKTLR